MGFLKRFWGWLMAKVKIKGHVKVDEVVQGVTATPIDVGTLGAAGTADSIIAVQVKVGTGPITSRNPKGVPTFISTLPVVSAVFVPPNIARITVGSPTAAVDAAFEVEVDAQ